MRAGLEPGQRVDSYDIVRLIGEGATGSVYEAMHAFMGRRVALKCLHTHHVSRNDVRERMRREAIVLSQIRHANVVTVWDAGMLDTGLVWIAMDLLEGETLREKLMGDRALSVQQALYVAAECADGVEAAHEVDVVHRDLKPENIFITDKNEVKVLDLGTAKFLGYGFQTTELNKVPGTLAYMSPEHISGELVSGRSDIYALGLVLYEMLAGHHAFARGTNADMPNRYELGVLHQFTQPPTLVGKVSGVSPALWHIIERAVAKKREQRIQTMREFAVLLREERSRVVGLERQSNGESVRGRNASLEIDTGWDTASAPSADVDSGASPAHAPATTRRDGVNVRPSVDPGRSQAAQARSRVNVPDSSAKYAPAAGRLSPVPALPVAQPPGQRPEKPQRSAAEAPNARGSSEGTAQNASSTRETEFVPATAPTSTQRAGAEAVASMRVSTVSAAPGSPREQSVAAATPYAAPARELQRGAARRGEPTPPPVSNEPPPSRESLMDRLGRRSPVFLLLVGLGVSAPFVGGMALLSSFLKARPAATAGNAPNAEAVARPQTPNETAPATPGVISPPAAVEPVAAAGAPARAASEGVDPALAGQAETRDGVASDAVSSTATAASAKPASNPTRSSTATKRGGKGTRPATPTKERQPPEVSRGTAVPTPQNPPKPASEPDLPSPGL